MIKARLMWRIVYPALFVTASVLFALFYPMLMLMFYAGAFVLLMLSRQLNFYKMIMVLTRYARTIERLRVEIRAKLHTGFIGNSVSLDEQNEGRSRVSRCF